MRFRQQTAGGFCGDYDAPGLDYSSPDAAAGRTTACGHRRDRRCRGGPSRRPHHLRGGVHASSRHSDEVRLQDRREAAYTTYINQAQTFMENLRTSADSLQLRAVAAELDQNLQAVRLVGTSAAISSAESLQSDVTDAYIDVLDTKRPGVTSDRYVAVLNSGRAFERVIRDDTGIPDADDQKLFAP